MNPITVGVVEDNPGFRAMLEILVRSSPQLRLQGSHSHGHEAIATFSHAPPDIALIDLGLPDMGGADVIRALAVRGCATACLVLTVYDDDDHLFEALKAGALGYLLKNDVLSPKLIELIHQIHAGEAPMSPGIARRILKTFHKPELKEIVTEVKLSPREYEVLGCLAEGLPTREVARVLHISYETVRAHQKTLYQKMHVHSAPELLAKTLGRRAPRLIRDDDPDHEPTH